MFLPSPGASVPGEEKSGVKKFHSNEGNFISNKKRENALRWEYFQFLLHPNGSCESDQMVAAVQAVSMGRLCPYRVGCSCFCLSLHLLFKAICCLHASVVTVSRTGANDFESNQASCQNCYWCWTKHFCVVERTRPTQVHKTFV